MLTKRKKRTTKFNMFSFCLGFDYMANHVFHKKKGCLALSHDG